MTKTTYAIPPGKYLGDLFFITDDKNKILHGFVWTGESWAPECIVWNVEEDFSGTPNMKE
jgi:hypothetical protein